MNSSRRFGRSVGVLASELNFPENWSAPLHLHANHEELLVITKGEIEIRSGAQTWQGREGSVIFYPRGVEHNESALKRKPVRLCCLHWKSSSSKERDVVVHPDSFGRIQTAARWILDWKNRGGAHSSAAMAFLMESIHLELKRPPLDPKVLFAERAKAYMLLHLAQPLTLALLSKVAGLSKCHFSTKFTMAMGISAMSYLRFLRVQTAESLILTTSLPFRTIAELVGLQDEFHFSRVFRRERGFPPSELQNGRSGRRLQVKAEFLNLISSVRVRLDGSSSHAATARSGRHE